ncbi:S-layer homology domain-containing protein, partial [Macellibacteroides fermentans]|uniref:S-layer homology domain-containing protein n=1 Tax=Macellibacteroides fermentans TaxID=879969 RepID=UPI00406D2DEE
ILSFVLVLSLVLGSFSMAFAATPATSLSDIAGIANEDAIQVNNDLGIIKGFPDGSFKPEQLVNRAEFAAMITRALAVPESALAGYTSTTFKDTAGYGWAVPYLAFAQSKGIMIGDGQGNAMPGRTINVNEAMTMVLRALGYVNHSSALVGNWPSNYVTVAQNVGLYDDVATAVTVDRANAAQIIYNALTVQKVAVNADGETTFLTLSGSTEPAVLFNTGLGATKQAGAALDPSAVDSKINLTKYAGMYGYAYTKSGSVVAFVVDSTNVTGDVKTSNTELKAADGTYKFKTATPALNAKVVPYFQNGRIQSGATTISFGGLTANAKFVTVNGDISGKTINDIYSISVWDVTDAKKATAADIADIEDQEFAGIDFTTVDDEIDYNSFQLVGAKSLADIKKDNVVYIYTHNKLTTGEIVKIAVGTDVVAGKVTAYKSADKEFVVNGTTYKTASEAGITGDVSKAFDSNDLGKDVELYLDAYGYVYDYKVTSASTDKYGVIEKYTDAGITPEIKLFTAADSASKVFKLTKDGNTDVNATAGATNAGVIVGYALNSSGEISDAVTSTTGTATLAGVRSIDINGTSYPISTDVVVFTVSSTGTAADVALSSIDKVRIGSLGQVAYLLNSDNNKVVALVVLEGVADKTTDDVYFVINDTEKVYDATDDAKYTKIFGLSNGSTFDKMLVEGDDAAVQVPTLPALWTAKLTADGFLKDTTVSAINLATGSAVKTADVSDAGSALTVTNGATTVYNISKDVVVYELVTTSTGGFDKYVVSTLDRIRALNTVYMYSTLNIGDKDYDGYDIVIFVK